MSFEIASKPKIEKRRVSVPDDAKQECEIAASSYVSYGSKCEELSVSKASQHYPNDQTLFGMCEKVRRRANC
jgi:hypothetical protein